MFFEYTLFEYTLFLTSTSIQTFYNTKFRTKMKILKIGAKTTLFRYFQIAILEEIFSFLKTLSSINIFLNFFRPAFVQGPGPDIGLSYTKYIELDCLKPVMVVRYIIAVEET